jgi:hypothetical protein
LLKWLRRYRVDIAGMLRELAGNRLLSLSCAGAIFLLFILAKIGYSAWPCPFYLVVHLPCPGCGLTHACMALSAGDWKGMLGYHPFAPYFLALGLLCLPGIFLPARLQVRWAGGVADFEGRTGLNAVILLLFVVYGVARLFWEVFRGLFLQG